MCRATLAFAVVAVLSACLVASSARAQLPDYLGYRLLDGDTLYYDQGSGSWFSHMNNSYQVFTSGSSGDPGQFSRLWDNGFATPYSWDSTVFDFVNRGHKHNEHGEMAGMLSYTDDRFHQHAFVTVNRVVTELQPLEKAHYNNPFFANLPTCGYAWAYDINESGDVSGWSSKFENDVLQYRAVVWSNGIPTEYPGVNGYHEDSIQYEQVYINNAGQIAGIFKTTDSANLNTRKGFYSDGGVLKEIIPFTSQPPLTGSTECEVWDINDSGLVVGSARINVNGIETRHAFIFDIASQTLTNIHGGHFAGSDAQGSKAVSINSWGQVVGFYTPSFSAQAGLVYDPVDDSTYLINDLLAESVWKDEFGSQNIGNTALLYDINDNGVILGRAVVGTTKRLAIYAPIQGDLVVNSEDDDDDLVPGDGDCYTGQRNELGFDECTMRAALQEINALAGRDTVTFDIPTGSPSIKPVTGLPGVTEEAVIDATTQPNSHRVEISGELLGAGSGLNLTAGNTELYGLLLNKFPDYGLVMSANDSNRIESSALGTDATGTADRGNAAGGLLISNSSGNRIGDQVNFDEGVIVAFNKGPGVRVSSGDRNLIARNYIYNNDGLGIDLDPFGVNPNDTLDADIGPNTLLNYPTIDSVVSGQLYGTLHGNPDDTYIVELYRSDSCDASGYGEGQEPLLTSLANTNADGIAKFDFSASGETLTGGQVFTLLSFDEDNTSEFSPCWSSSVRLVDGNEIPIANQTFALYKVAFDPPVLTETFVDSVTTDFLGYLPPEIPGVAAGDSIKFVKLVDSIMASKSGPFPVLARIYLDNAKIDSVNSTTVYYESMPESGQSKVIKVDHTTLAYNLYVSIEWDADPSYVDALVDGLKKMNNYLYDVFDGQLRLDSVEIADTKVGWDMCDVRVFASHMMWPQATTIGALMAGKEATVRVPPVWYGSDTAGRNESAKLLYPSPSESVNFRTTAHELGHYLFGFLDEYRFVAGGLCNSGLHNYGFMQSQYESREPTASEMSSSRMYTDAACRNTEQWDLANQSCWDHLKSYVDGITSENSVLTPILRPEDRNLPSGAIFLSGPNDGSGLNYDVGALTTYIQNTFDPLIPPVRVYINGGGAPIANAVVLTVEVGGADRELNWGRTSDSGQCALLGHDYDFRVVAAGRSFIPFKRAEIETWYYGVDSTTARALLKTTANEQALADSIINMSISPIAGDYPLVVTGRLDPVGRLIDLHALNLLPAAPDLEVTDTAGVDGSVSFGISGNRYSATVSGDLPQTGTFTVNAVDDSLESFAFDLPYAIAVISDNLGGHHLSSVDGAFELHLNTDSIAFDSAIIITSPYPVLRDGLADAGRQISDAHSVSFYPSSPLAGNNLLAIRYDHSLVDTASDPKAEQTIRIFRWTESAPQWTFIPSAVNAELHEVTAAIDQEGVYAAFTINIAVGINDENQPTLPTEFDLGQNYPNPFNPTTSIEYSLPIRTHVRIDVFNILGQRVATLIDREQPAGTFSIDWNSTDDSGERVASGVYLYRIQADNFVRIRKMLLLK